MGKGVLMNAISTIDEEVKTVSEVIDYVKNTEQEWLMSNRINKNFFYPQPMKNASMKVCFIGSYKDYILSEYNVTKTIVNTKSFSIENNKYDYAIQLYYKYNGNDDRMFNNEIISLYYINKKMNLIHIERIQ